MIDFSVLTERTEYGPRSYPRSYPLNKLDDLPESLRELVLQLMTSLPVSQFLKVSHFQASLTERVPLTYVEGQPSMAITWAYRGDLGEVSVRCGCGPERSIVQAAKL